MTTTKTYYRIDRADRDLVGLLDPDIHSTPWVDGAMVAACPTCGTDLYTERVDGIADCSMCGQVDLTGSRPGLSVCETTADLRAYFRDRELDEGPLVLVELEGEPTGVYDHDANAPGDPILIRATQIMTVTPITDIDDL